MIHSLLRRAAFLLFFVVAGLRAATTFDVTDYGARGDGTTLDTPAIQKAIDACAEAGGGTVLFPTGRFLSANLTLKSNVTINLTPAAVLLASTRPDDYTTKHLLIARDAENVAIIGTGTIDGQGDNFFTIEAETGRPRPKAWRLSPLIELIACRNVRVEGITILKAPAWTLRPKNCTRVTIRGISILNNVLAINTDGIDVDSSRDVVISDCIIKAGDDCIVLKTTDRAGEPTATENVVVTNCVLESMASALKLGTESLGDYRHCVFSNCVIRNSRTGIALMAKDGGTMESILFSNISISTKPKAGTGWEWPIHVDSEKRADNSKLSKIRDVTFSDISIQTRGRNIIQGQPGAPAENLVFRNVTMRVLGHEDIAKAKKVTGGSRTTEQILDLGNKPAAFIAGYVNGLVLDGVRVSWPGDQPQQPRHFVYGLELDGADLREISGGATDATTPAILTEKSRNVRQ